MAISSTTTAVLQFLPNWETIQRGQIRQGEKLVIEYDAERLAQARTWFRGALFGELNVIVKFHPTGQIYTGNCVETVLSDGPRGHGVTIGLEPKAYEVTVPLSASNVEIWFHAFYQTTRYYEAWDSRHGQNYWFSVRDDHQHSEEEP
jgi:hypothetical protein